MEQKEKRILAWSKPQFNEVMGKMGIIDENVEEVFIDGAIISINDTHGKWSQPWFNLDHSNVIRLWFDDVEQDTDKFSPTNQEKVKAFTVEDAKNIRDFIKKNKKKEVFIVHCSAGISRSGAVAQFICDFFRCDRTEFLRNNKHILPNGRVTRMLNNIERNSK
jgi:predicted protein tyrosine phosphatase